VITRASPPLPRFQEKGFGVPEFFPHRALIIRKQYPDTLRLFEGRGMTPSELRACEFFQLNLYSDKLGGLPAELFTDPAINWHHQQLGERGLIAAAGLCVQDGTLLVSAMQSDLCQQLFRSALKGECKTQVEKRFGAWHKLLFNAILDFSNESGIAVVYSPTSEWILQATRKPVQPGLFQRIYDFPSEFYRARRVVRRRAEYWEVPVVANAHRVVRLVPAALAEPPRGKLICIFHDTEENLGGDGCAEESRRSLAAMLQIESARRVRTTYNVVGSLFACKKDEIRAAGPHCLAFHSYDHVLENERQLPRCREVDLQVRGYRTPNSRITPELTDYSLSYYNFEWLASGLHSLLRDCPGIDYERLPTGFERLAPNGCGLQNGIVKIPVLTDDHLIATGQMDYEEWSRRLLETARNSAILSFGLHDCYARFWIDSYAELLDALSGIGRFVTADELCDITFRRQG